MNNKIKRVLLIILICVLAVECVYFAKVKQEIVELDEKLKSEQPVIKEENTEPIEPPTPPMITINSEINHSLDVYSYRNSIIDRAVGVARGIVYKLIEEGVYLSDATVSNVTLIDSVSIGDVSSVDVFNVEVLLTDADGEKTIYNSEFMFFYNRWDEDGKGSYYISTLTSELIDSKYGEAVTDTLTDTYKVACVMECYEYLKRGQLIAEDALESSAYAKAVAFSKTVGVAEVISDKYTVSVEGDTKSFNYGTNDESVAITVVYTYFDDIQKWAFLYAET